MAKQKRRSELRFVNLFDAHYGHERTGGHLKPLHDQAAIDAALKFSADFKPDILTFGGDMADCGAISHWKDNKQRQNEGVKLRRDFEGLKTNLLAPAAATIAKGGLLRYHLGNHCQWLEDYVDANPALEGLIDLDSMLGLTVSGWEIIPLGGASKLGKLYIVHGDQIKGGVNVAKRAVDLYQRNIHFGHHHTFALATNVAPLDEKPKQGVAVPCLCKLNPGYAKNAPNRWLQGCEYGWIEPNGNFHYHVVQIIGGQFHAEGRLYKV